MSWSRKDWPLDPSLIGWHLLASLNDHGPVSTTRNSWHGRGLVYDHGRDYSWRSVLPFVKAGFVEISKPDGKSKRRTMRITPLGVEWVTKWHNHRMSHVFQRASKRARKGAKTTRTRQFVN